MFGMGFSELIRCFWSQKFLVRNVADSFFAFVFKQFEAHLFMQAEK